MAYCARVGPGRGAVTAACGTFAGGPTLPPPVFLRASAPVLPDQINSVINLNGEGGVGLENVDRLQQEKF